MSGGGERRGGRPQTSRLLLLILLLICQNQIVTVIKPRGEPDCFSISIFPFLVTARNTATGRWRVNTATVTTASVNMASAPRDMGREAVVEEAKVTTDSPKYKKYQPIIVIIMDNAMLTVLLYYCLLE